ncbi:MAG: sortase [Ruminococcaceae bacterium]|nr:sortase [Oscillospiraceae bacterium]
MRKATGLLLVLSGAVLIILALLLFGFNRQEEIAAGEAADNVMKDLLAEIEENRADSSDDGDEITTDTDDDTSDDLTEESEKESALDIFNEESDTETDGEAVDTEEICIPEPTVSIGGYEYIGYLSLPSINVTLPIMADWDYTRLNIAPCRQFGTAAGGDLVIAGHDYSTHFARLGSMKAGEVVEFTDAAGLVYRYSVTSVDVLAADAVDDVQDSEAELILYTCTYTGTSRITVFCDAVE